MSDIPLTPEQRLFAAEHHGLVYAFLKEKNLPESEYYDIVIFGFLRAVRRYFTETALSEYKFSTIAWNCMYVDLCNHFKAQHRQKRTATVISIHISRSDNGLPLEETIGSPDELMQQLETRLLLHDLANHVSRQQMDIDLDGSHELKTCYGDILKTINALMDYSRMLKTVCGQWNLQGFHKATYEYHADKLQEIARKYQAAIGYDYDAAVEKCRKKQEREQRRDDVGEDALALASRRR